MRVAAGQGLGVQELAAMGLEAQGWEVGAQAMAGEVEAAPAEKDWAVGAMAGPARVASEEQGWEVAGSAGRGWEGPVRAEGVTSARVEPGSAEAGPRATKPAVMAAAALGSAAAAAAPRDPKAAALVAA